MWESKMSLLLPMELIKLYKKWNNEYVVIIPLFHFNFRFCCLLESKQHSWPSSSFPLLHEILRELRETAETYEQCQEFLSTYSVGSSWAEVKQLLGPSFPKICGETESCLWSCAHKSSSSNVRYIWRTEQRIDHLWDGFGRTLWICSKY